MFSDSIKHELKRMLIGLALLCTVMYLIFALFGHYKTDVVFGALLGLATAYVNFVLLGITVQKTVDKGVNAARAYMSMSYTLRMILIAAAVIFAMKSPDINYLAAIIPLIFPRIVIMVCNIKKEKSDERA